MNLRYILQIELPFLVFRIVKRRVLVLKEKIKPKYTCTRGFY